MKATSSSSSGSPWWEMFVLALYVLTLSGCMEDDRQVQELRQLRERLAAAEKKVAEAAQQPVAAPMTPAPPPQDLADSAPKLAAARIAALEKELQEARNAAPASIPPATARDNAESFGELVEAMESDLLSRVGELRKVLGRTVPAANIVETTVTHLSPLEKIVSAYESQVVFKVVDSAGQTQRQVFRIQPGLDGHWHLPDAAVVKQQILAFINRGAPQPLVTPHDKQHASYPLPLPPGYQKQPQLVTKPQPIPPDTLIVPWHKAPETATKPPDAAQAATSTVQPATTSSAKAPPPTTTPRLPKPVMPVEKDVLVRFE